MQCPQKMQQKTATMCCAITHLRDQISNKTGRAAIARAIRLNKARMSTPEGLVWRERERLTELTSCLILLCMHNSDMVAPKAVPEDEENEMATFLNLVPSYFLAMIPWLRFGQRTNTTRRHEDTNLNSQNVCACPRVLLSMATTMQN